MLRLYDYLASGNAYKVRLLLTQLGLPFERVEMDLRGGATRTPQFLAINPNHKIPLLQWPDGQALAESNAILFHLADGSRFLPDDSFQQGQVLQWMFFEQYSHEPYIAVVRSWHRYGLVDEHRAELAEKVARGYEALGLMEQHLAGHPFLVGDRYSVADIALYAYTHVAEEGKFELSRFPAIRSWMKRVAGEPRHVTITAEVGTLISWP
jgi:glutathione S-transferase